MCSTYRILLDLLGSTGFVTFCLGIKFQGKVGLCWFADTCDASDCCSCVKLVLRVCLHDSKECGNTATLGLKQSIDANSSVGVVLINLLVGSSKQLVSNLLILHKCSVCLLPFLLRWHAWWRYSRRKGIYFNCKSFVKRKVICNASSIPLKRALLPCLWNQSYVSSQCFWEDRRSWYTCLCWDRSCKLRIGSMTVWMVACLSHAWICHWSNCCSVVNSEMKKGAITPMRDVVKVSACRKDFCPPSFNLSTACFLRQVVLLEVRRIKQQGQFHVPHFKIFNDQWSQS